MIMLLIAAVLLASLVLAVFLVYRHMGNKKTDLRMKQLEKPVAKLLDTVDLDRAEKLMIVAHPDDETIWGGGHLLQDTGRYLVVCITAGTDSVRDEELKNAMAICQAQYLKLGFPDLDRQQKQDRWKTAGTDIKATLEIIMTAKDWQSIVTHNPRGEYGHRHHKMTSRFVTNTFRKRIGKDNLFYFVIYYKPRYRKKLRRHQPLPADIADLKISGMLPEYPSQAGPRKSYEHMFHYEDWVKYRDWNGFTTFLRSKNIIP